MPKGRYWNITEDGDIGPSGTTTAGQELLRSIIAQYLRTVEDDNGDLQLEAMDDFIDEYFQGGDTQGFRSIKQHGHERYPYSNVGKIFIRTKHKIGKRGKWKQADFLHQNEDDWIES